MTKTHNTEHKEHHKNTEHKGQKTEENKNDNPTKSVHEQNNDNELIIKTIETETKNEQKILPTETEKLKAENLELKEQFLRLKADFENYKKRILRERQQQDLRIKAETISPFINILDNLERAKISTENKEQKSEVKNQNTENSAEVNYYDPASLCARTIINDERLNSILQGIDLIIKNLHSILSAMGVEKIKAIGELFNPNLHETLIAEEKEDCVEGTILEELTAGYKIKDVIIRTAKVKVAKQKEKVS